MYKITNSLSHAIDFPAGDTVVRVPTGESTHDALPKSVIETIQQGYTPSGLIRLEKVGEASPTVPAEVAPVPNEAAPGATSVAGSPPVATKTAAAAAEGAPPAAPSAPAPAIEPTGGDEHSRHARSMRR